MFACTCVCKLCKGGRRWGAAEGWCPRGPVRHQGPSRDSGGREDPGLCPGQRDVVSWRGQVSGGPSQPAVGLTSAGAEGLFGKVVSGSRLTAGHMAVRRGKRDLRLVDSWGPGDVLATVRNGRGSRTVGAPGGLRRREAGRRGAGRARRPWALGVWAAGRGGTRTLCTQLPQTALSPALGGCPAALLHAGPSCPVTAHDSHR